MIELERIELQQGGQLNTLTPLVSECTMAGMPAGSFDCLARSKSESMMWPDWCNRISI
jgi:hypothetical protein